MELSDRMPVGYRGITWLMALLGAVVMVISIWGCAAGQRPPESENTPVLSQEGKDERLLVVTTIFPYYDFVRQIAGDKVKLKLVVPAGMDSHSFEPTPADMIAMQEADVLICNGGEMEQWVKKVLGSLDTSHMKVLTMMDYVDVVEEEHVEGMEENEHHHEDVYEEDGHEKDDHEEEDGHEMHIEYDEHIWTSPVNAQAIVKIISRTPSWAAGYPDYIHGHGLHTMSCRL